MYPGTWAATSPQQPAVIMADGSETLTYAELDERSARLARLLYDRGLRRGDNVALLSENNLRYYDAYWAALRSGLYLTAVNHHLQQAEISYILNDCGAQALIVSAGQADQALAVAGETPGIGSRFAFGGAVPGHEDYERALAATPAEPPADNRVGADMLYSSGTTGLPKAIKLPLQERRVDEPGDPLVTVFGRMYGFDRDTVYLSPAPLYHAAPLRFGGFVQALGGTVVVLPSFDPVTALQAIERYRVTHSQWVPTMFVRMLKLPEDQRPGHDLSSHRLAMHAAAPCPVDVKRAMIDWWGPILQRVLRRHRGQRGHVHRFGAVADKPGSVGPAAWARCTSATTTATSCRPATSASSTSSATTVPFDYHNDPDKTRQAQHPDHPTWTTTGDIGYLDDDGYLFLTDRQGVHDHLRRGEHLPAGDRERAGPAPQGVRCRGHRRARPGDGRAGQGGGPARARA